MSTENLLAESSKVDVEAVGQRLKAARQQLNYTQQQVSQRLYLKLVVIQRIEDGMIPEDLHSTFMRGYIRSYARLVKIQEDELLPRYSPAESGRLYRTLRHSVARRSRLGLKEDHLALWSWLVLLFLLILTVVWWWQQRLGSGDRIAREMESSAVMPTTPTAGHLKESASNPVILDHEKSATSSDIVGELQAPSATGPQIQPEGQLQPVAKEQKHAISVMPEIRFTFSGKCWLEVRDSERLLFTGVRSMGETLLLSGQPPYHLSIGAPEAVRVHYQGREVTLGSYIMPQSRIAHLTLTEE